MNQKGLRAHILLPFSDAKISCRVKRRGEKLKRGRRGIEAHCFLIASVLWKQTKTYPFLLKNLSTVPKLDIACKIDESMVEFFMCPSQIHSHALSPGLSAALSYALSSLSPFSHPLSILLPCALLCFLLLSSPSLLPPAPWRHFLNSIVNDEWNKWKTNWINIGSFHPLLFWVILIIIVVITILCFSRSQQGDQFIHKLYGTVSLCNDSAKSTLLCGFIYPTYNELREPCPCVVGNIAYIFVLLNCNHKLISFYNYEPINSNHTSSHPIICCSISTCWDYRWGRTCGSIRVA